MNFKFKMSTSVCIFVGLIPSTYPFSKQIRPDVSLELLEFHSNILQLSSITQCPFLGIFVQNFFFIQKAINLSSKSLLDLTKQVSTCFEDFMNIS